MSDSLCAIIACYRTHSFQFFNFQLLYNYKYIIPPDRFYIVVQAQLSPLQVKVRSAMLINVMVENIGLKQL